MGILIQNKIGPNGIDIIDRIMFWKLTIAAKQILWKIVAYIGWLISVSLYITNTINSNGIYTMAFSTQIIIINEMSTGVERKYVTKSVSLLLIVIFVLSILFTITLRLLIELFMVLIIFLNRLILHNFHHTYSKDKILEWENV